MTTTTRRNRPVAITDAPEHRSIPIERVELRDADGDDDNEVILEGYASTFEEYEMYGGPQSWGWIERIDPKAFDVTLREKPDLHLLINHAGMPLARTKSGNLDLVSDKTGLKVVARLDKRDPEVQSLVVKMERGDMDEMSFAFRVKAQEWKAADGFDDDNQSYRTITEVSLHKGDVSVVNWGANPTTSVGVRSAVEALEVLANADVSEFAELRSDQSDLLIRAAEKLSAGMVKPTVHITNVNVRQEAEKESEVSDEVQAGTAGDVIAEGEGLLDAAGDIAELLSAALEPYLKRLEALEVSLTGTVAADEEPEAEPVEEAPVVEEARADRRQEMMAAMGVLPEGKLSAAAALAFED